MPLHPQSQAFIDLLRQLSPPDWSEMDPDEARTSFAGLGEFFGTGPDVASINDHRSDGGVPIRVYRPVAGRTSPVVVYYHGGGWVLGDIDTHDSLCRRLAVSSGCAVASVGYPRSPETRHPAVDDACLEAADWVIRHAGDLGIDGSRVALAGDSAGGHLAAIVARRCRDVGRSWKAKLQLLIYPVMEPDFQTPSYESFAEGHGLTREAMKYFWRCYAGTGEVPAAAMPPAAESLVDLPPAHIITAEYDVLRDEGEAYAAMLANAGVPVTHHQYDGMLHGFVHMAGFFDVGREAGEELGSVLASHLQPDA